MTSSLIGSERLVDAAIAKLQSGMAERVAQINAESTTNLGITAPQASDFYTAPIDELPRAPAIIVVEGNTTWGEEGSHSFITSVDLLVFILEEDTDRERLGRRLQRQARCVIETLWDDEPREALTDPDTGAQLAFRVRPRQSIPGRVFDADAQNSWRGFYRVIFQASMFEGQ